MDLPPGIALGVHGATNYCAECIDWLGADYRTRDIGARTDANRIRGNLDEIADGEFVRGQSTDSAVNLLDFGFGQHPNIDLYVVDSAVGILPNKEVCRITCCGCRNCSLIGQRLRHSIKVNFQTVRVSGRGSVKDHYDMVPCRVIGGKLSVSC